MIQSDGNLHHTCVNMYEIRQCHRGYLGRFSEFFDILRIKFSCDLKFMSILPNVNMIPISFRYDFGLMAAHIEKEKF